MPEYRDLEGALVTAFEKSGVAAVSVRRARRNPRKFIVATKDGPLEVWLYIWTLTHGGRASLPNEFRIQMTSVTSPLDQNSAGPTALLGYHAELGVFAGFDLGRHRTFTTGSPSVQIDVQTLLAAQQDGLAFQRKTNDEIAVAVRPDQLCTYIENAASLHKVGVHPQTLELLQRAATLQPVADSEIQGLDTSERRRVVHEVVRHVRDTNFREQVLRAYDRACAVTGIQLRLVEAAHILPVPAAGSTDHVTNGLALAPTYHDAFDRGIIFLDEDYRMQLNKPKAEELKRLELGGELRAFAAPLGRKIALPPDRQQWPGLKYIREANRLRGIAR